VRGRIEGPEVRQTLSEHSACCQDCDATCDARNAQAWATNHVKRHPGHVVKIELCYEARAVGVSRHRADEPALL
jgi:hypothetical protein